MESIKSKTVSSLLSVHMKIFLWTRGMFELPNTMLPYYACNDIWLQVLTFLCTRDVIQLLSHTCKRFYAIAEGVRRKRQDIYRLLSKFVNDVDGFRRLMKKTGGIIVGDMQLSLQVRPYKRCLVSIWSYTTSI